MFLVLGVLILSAPYLMKKLQREVPKSQDVTDRSIPVTNIDDIYWNSDNQEEEDSNDVLKADGDTDNETEKEEEQSQPEVITNDLSDIVTYSQSIVQERPESIPEYSGEDVIILNDNLPNYTDYDLLHIKGDYYSELDGLGRCGVAYAMLERSLMPTEERGSIGQIKPSGWNQEKYPGIVDSEPPYLYNRCHLIAYSLTGQNANEKNLITGTRYFNINGMLGYESAVAACVEYSGYRVLYRVSPYFKANELLARGVEIEAYSVEDKGGEVCFHVFIYNVQPGITINYSDGSSSPE